MNTAPSKDAGNTQSTRSFHASSVQEFLQTPDSEIVGKLSMRVGLAHSGDESQQIKAWQKQITILKRTLPA